MATKHFDMIVIGGGSGLSAAYFGQQDGKNIALVDRLPNALGGTCVNRGCIPTKGLIQAAETMKTIRSAEKFGIRLPEGKIKVDLPALVETVLTRRKEGASGTKEWVDGAFTPFYGHARFVDEKTIEMADGSTLTGDKIFIATGARPAIPPVSGLKDVDYWTNEEAIENKELPDRLIVLGGGYVGCEFAHFFAALGSQVTVIERGEAPLPAEDHEMQKFFAEEFSKHVDLRMKHDAKSVRQDGKQIVVEAEGPDGPLEIRGDRLLVATGRAPNTDEMGLDKAGVKTQKGWIVVDDHLRTTNADVYAYGDVIGQAMFKHTSSKEGEIAYQNAFGADRVMDYTANPHAVFSNPQIGSVGLTEEQVKEKGLDYKVRAAKYTDAMKGQIIGSPPGFVKLLVEKKTDRILGFHMAGPNAADLVHEVVVAMENKLPAQAIRETIHIHPTMPELIKIVFDATAE